MKTYENLAQSDWEQALARPRFEPKQLISKVETILQTVQEKGDQALLDYTKTFDKVALSELVVEVATEKPIISEALQISIQTAYDNIFRFHQAQVKPVEKIETMPGVVCWRKQVAIQKVGLYVPGGSAPLLSTVLMLAIPAKIAGCKEIVLCTPPQKDGSVHPAILFAAKLAGVTKIIKVGGAQAIAALIHGTESVPKVDKIFGPGNQYVTAAKLLAQMSGVAIDMPAGPSEVLVMADASSDPAFVAADLLAQAEHGPDSQVILLCETKAQAALFATAVDEQLAQLPRAEIAQKAMENSVCVIEADPSRSLDIVNFYAPEHLIIATKDAAAVAEKIENAGSVFIGAYTPESVGDYASGTNHTLPTNGAAKAYSGVSVDSFMKQITFQELSKVGIQNIGPAVEEMAAAESLEGHKNAVTVRLNALKK